MWLMLLHIFSKYCLSAAAHSAAANSVNVRRAVAVITADAVNSKNRVAGLHGGEKCVIVRSLLF